MGVKQCIMLLGGSFDPVHNGHVALARHFRQLIQPDEIRILPAGNPWQKPPLRASAQDRVNMLQLAFAAHRLPVTIDQREIQHAGPTYTIDTLRSLRNEVGAEVSLVFLIGADQLQKLPTWRQWQQLFDYAHICAASRPGFGMAAEQIPPPVEQEFKKRASSPEQLHHTASGLTYLTENLSVDISATAIRAALQQDTVPAALMPATVLDYIKLHHLYQS